MKTLSVLLLGLWSLASAAEPLVTNVRAAQQQGTKLVDVWYDVSGVSTAVYVSLQVYDNGGTSFAVPATALSGDLGGGVLPGRNKHIVWNAGNDWVNLTAVASRSGWTEAYQPLSLSFSPFTGRFVLIEHRTSNIQRRTEENQERKMGHSGGCVRLLCSRLGVRC